MNPTVPHIPNEGFVSHPPGNYYFVGKCFFIVM